MTWKFDYKHINPRNYAGHFSDRFWYLKANKDLKHYLYTAKAELTEEEKGIREELKLLIGELLREGEIGLGGEGENHDQSRLPIDHIVIHHTAGRPDAPLERIDAAGLLGIYLPEHLNEKRPYYKKPIWSGHFFENRQTFVPYHYLIWGDGRSVQALKDEYIGWHAGNWNINQRSIGIAFMGDFTNSQPTQAAIATAKTIIKKYPNTTILGHREVTTTTECPGNTFLAEQGWKHQLLV